MGKTSSAVKARWNREHYDCLGVRLPKGSLDEVKWLASTRGLTVSQFLRQAILQSCTDAELLELDALTQKMKTNPYISTNSGGG